jgi:hypothetical protein
MILVKPAGKSLQEFATLMQERSSYELDAAPNTQSLVFFFFLFHLASVRRLKSLLKSAFLLFTMKNVTKAVIFARYLLKTK